MGGGPARSGRAEQTQYLLVLDEVQKIPRWSETVKRLWDEDTRAKRPLKVVLLGSAPLLIASGLTESLAGRFETLHLPHWPFSEMREAFGWSLDQYIFHGGYPGAAPLIDEPALLRRLFDLACHYSGQVLSYTKMPGQLQDAGNTTTLAHYLDLLAGAGMVRALMTATTGQSLTEARADREFWGRLVESAVGAHLANAATAGECELYYWRERNEEVDFVVKAGRRLTAIEVKSGRAPLAHAGTAAFAQAFKVHRTLLVGGDGVGVEDFLSRPVSHWLQS
ncbi:MAG: ATP-binding protein [Burkholderiaceae bacterium]